MFKRMRTYRIRFQKPAGSFWHKDYGFPKCEGVWMALMGGPDYAIIEYEDGSVWNTCESLEYV